MNLTTETTTKLSKGTLPNLQKGLYINHSVDELKEMSEKSAFDFANLIKEKKWLKLLYTGDWTHNQRLNFVRIWYYQKYRGIKPDYIKQKEQHEKGQQQLPLL